MKRNFLLLCVFFLCSCSSDSFQNNTGCPVKSGQTVTVSFEYGSAELNEKAVQQVKEIAQNVKENNQYVCFLGRLSYQGVPAYQAVGAIDRAKNTAALFLKEGVDPTRIYIGILAEKARIGLSKPLRAVDEEHVLNVLIGN